jgi:hypothetical protein
MYALFIVGLTMFGAEAFAAPCTIKVGEVQEETAFNIGRAMDATLLKTRDLVETTEQDVGSEKFDFTLDIDPSNKNSKGLTYVVMNVSSQKILNRIYGLEGQGKTCNTYSTIFFTSFSYVARTSQKTATQLIRNLPSCEILKSLETDALRQLECH